MRSTQTENQSLSVTQLAFNWKNIPS